MKKLLLVLVFGLLTAPALAEGEAGSATETLKTEMSPSSAFSAALELRPSWQMNAQRVHTENSAEFAYQLKTDRTLGYVQYFDSNLFDFERQDSGLGLIVQEGFLRMQMDNLWKNRTGLSFGYEPRLYLPTNADARKAGMIAELRNHLQLTKVVSKVLSFRVEEIPVLLAFDRAGSYSVKDDKDAANPIFQNRIYLVVDVTFTKDLTLEFPLRFESKRYRAYNEASNSDTWEHVVYIWPELDYAVNQRVTLGLSYYSDNFIKSDLTGFTLGEGFKKGVAQLIVRATL